MQNTTRLSYVLCLSRVRDLFGAPVIVSTNRLVCTPIPFSSLCFQNTLPWLGTFQVYLDVSYLQGGLPYDQWGDLLRRCGYRNRQMAVGRT